MVSVRLSASHNELDELACQIPLTPSYSLTTTLSPLPALSGPIQPSIAALYAKLAFAKRQIFILEAENALLREESEKLRLMVKVSLAETATLQAVLEYTQDEKGTSRPAAADRDTILRLEKRLADYRNFVRALAEGQVLDPRIINYAQTGVDDGRDSDSMLVEAIQVAASENDSPWSRIFHALISNCLSGEHLTAANLVLKLRKDLHEMEKLARFWKSQAMLKSNTPAGTTSSLFSKNSGDSDGIEASSKPLPCPLTSPLGDALDTEELQNNGAFKLLVSCDATAPPTPMSLRHMTHTIAGSNGGKSNSLRPSVSDGLDVSAIRAPKCNQMYTKPLRRITFHDSLNLEAQITKKRHGFLMPCIKSVLQKHTSAPVNTHSLSTVHQAGDPSGFSVSPFPPNRTSASTTPTLDFSTTMHGLSWKTSQALQSAERLCATFSSGSLGSLEMSPLSDSNCSVITDSPTVLSVPEASLKVDVEKFVSLSESVGPEEFGERRNRDSQSQPNTYQGTGEAVTSHPSVNTDETVILSTLPPQCRKSAQDAFIELSTSVTEQSANDQSLTLPSVKHTVNPAANQPSQQATRMYRSAISIHPPEENVAHSRKSANPASTSILAPVPLQRAKTSGCTNEKGPSAAISFLKVARPSTRLVSMIHTPASAICTPKPRLSFIKSGLGKATAPVRPVNPAKKSMSMSRPQVPVARRIGLSDLANSHSRVRLCSDRTASLSASASHENVPILNTRLRVMNTCDLVQGKFVRSPPVRFQTQRRANLWGHTGVQEASNCSRLDSGGRVTRDNRDSLNAGLMRGVGQAVENPRIRGAVKLESREYNKRP